MNIQQLLKHPVHFCAFGFGSGLAPKAPGTFGTLMAVPIYLIIVQWPPLYYGLFVFAAGISGIYLCGKTAEYLRVHDCGGIVWDEMVGYWLTLFLIPFSWQTMLLGFLLFRLFDIWKPFPIHWLDKKVKGGFGIMIDDILAAIYAWFILVGLLYFFDL